MHAARNSKTSRASNRSAAVQNTTGATILPVVAVFLLVLCIGGLASWFSFVQGWTLYYGDAEAHLNNARRIIDSRTPGYEQIGTVWLPLPHLLLLPLVRDTSMWQSGMAGAVVGVLCFALAGTALFAAARALYGSAAAALCAALLLTLNPNLLYLQSTPMTEPVLLATLLGLLYFTVRFGRTQGMGAAVGAALCSAAASLTRYEGWFLIPFVCLYLLISGGRNRWKASLAFAAVAGAAPLYWLAHNLWFYSNPLEFYNGPYSAMAQNPHGYPGDGDWRKAWLFYRTAAEMCAGTATVVIGLIGIAAALWKRAWWPVFMLALIPFFYVMSIHGSSTPVWVPQLWFGSYYNTRYGIGVLPVLALAGAAIVAILPRRFQSFAAAGLAIASMAPWLAYPRPDNWITWKESQVNSDARRAWTSEAAAYLRASYRPGSGIFFSFGDLTGVLREAGIPLKDGLHEGNGPHALAAQMRPDLFLWEEWAIAIAGDSVSSAMMKAVKTGPPYIRVRTIQARGGPVVEIYRRSHDHPVH